ncbi:MAG: LPS export ABC transporter permease LptG [Burkholderiaceae bacterium]|jgi:lipopolysaccharide export system permease protein|nr:LPS export ABC transporter permease LptG [Burkholderiaceae bacterium]
MKTVRRLIYAEIFKAVSFITLGFVCLFFFFDLIQELQDVGKSHAPDYGSAQALLYVALLIPSHLYELLPITVLIGSIFVMARLAESSEYTILRTSGLGPWRALRTLLVLGLGFAVLTFCIGDYIAPVSGRVGQLLRARYMPFYPLAGNTGAWLKEKQGKHTYVVNVVSMTHNGDLKSPQIFEFDENNAFLSNTMAQFAHIGRDGIWTLYGAVRWSYPRPGNGNPADAQAVTRIETVHAPALSWNSTLTSEMVSVALLQRGRMSTIDLFGYIRHLSANGQTTRRYEIQFWRKVFYPLSCLVMVVMALPFAYLHFRQGGIAGYIFGGVMIGISFFLLNNVFGYMGNLNNTWIPWLAAAAPGIIYLLLSLGAFSWLVLRR